MEQSKSFVNFLETDVKVFNLVLNKICVECLNACTQRILIFLDQEFGQSLWLQLIIFSQTYVKCFREFLQLSSTKHSDFLSNT